jgi:hypothetical protein
MACLPHKAAAAERGPASASRERVLRRHQLGVPKLLTLRRRPPQRNAQSRSSVAWLRERFERLSDAATLSSSALLRKSWSKWACQRQPRAGIPGTRGRADLDI